jgi:hypothetical protein
MVLNFSELLQSKVNLKKIYVCTLNLSNSNGILAFFNPDSVNFANTEVIISFPDETLLPEACYVTGSVGDLL